MLPKDCRFQEMVCQEGPYKNIKMLVALIKQESGADKKIPLQFKDKDRGNFVQHKKIVLDMGGQFPPVAYHGALSGIPTKLTMSADFDPVVGNFYRFHEDLFPLKDFFAKFTKEAKING